LLISHQGCHRPLPSLAATRTRRRTHPGMCVVLRHYGRVRTVRGCTSAVCGVCSYVRHA
jgi:hypothetical protein